MSEIETAGNTKASWPENTPALQARDFGDFSARFTTSHFPSVKNLS